MRKDNDNSNIGAALIVGIVSVIIGAFMSNIFAGLIIGGIIFIFLLTHD